MSLNVLVWNEYHHEKTDDKVKEIYPNGIHTAIADFLSKEEDITCLLYTSRCV